MDEIVQDTEDIIQKLCRILVHELKNLIKSSPFFTKEPEVRQSLTDSRKVFMILKSFKQLMHSEDYVYRTINNEIIDPEFKQLVQSALKSKSIISLNDTKFDKSKLPLSIFIDGVMKLFQEGSLKNLIQMCHGKPKGRPKPLSREVYIDGYDIILNCILKPTRALFETKLSFAYSPGIPVIFHSNYAVVRSFAKKILELGVDDEEEIVKQILSKFNLSTYFTLVSREIIKEFNTKIEVAFGKGKIQTGNDSVSDIVMSTIKKCIGEDLFLIEISDKILTLCFQLVIRVLHVTKETINKKSMSAENLLRILDEVNKINFISHEFLETLVEICSEISGKDTEESLNILAENYNELFELLLKRFDALNHPCISAASEKISQRLAENMKQFKHIAGIYRLTNKKAPTKPSEYTNVTFKPVEHLVSKEFFIHLSPKLKSMLLNSIFQK